MATDSNSFRDLTQGVSARLATLRRGAPDVMKSFSELGRAAMAEGALTKMYAAHAIAAFEEFSRSPPT